MLVRKVRWSYFPPFIGRVCNYYYWSVLVRLCLQTSWGWALSAVNIVWKLSKRQPQPQEVHSLSRLNIWRADTLTMNTMNIHMCVHNSMWLWGLPALCSGEATLAHSKDRRQEDLGSSLNSNIKLLGKLFCFFLFSVCFVCLVYLKDMLVGAGAVTVCM